MVQIRAEWGKIVRPNGEHCAFQNNHRGFLARYVLWNPVTRNASFKEVNEPLILLGEFDSLEDAIKKVMKSC